MAFALRRMAAYLGLVAEDVDDRDHAYSESDAEVSWADGLDGDKYEVPDDHPEVRSTVAAFPAAGQRTTISTVPITLHPHAYNDVLIVGHYFREGVPVIMDLTSLDDADAKRLVDFGAGLIFGLRGDIDRVDRKVFLLSPEGVTVTSDKRAAS
ncbi:MAG TPA: cell division protein SepF [Streptosporangiaceae bacterium]